MTTSKLKDDAPHCPNCGLAMIRIGTLPGISDRPGVEVFRCPRCNALVTREF
jgi:Zn-finger nucleic acid-binding protein